MNTLKSSWFVIALAAFFIALSGCDKTTLSGSKVTKANYDQISTGMSKSQVEMILGAPTKSETKDMVIFKKTTYRYEDGSKFAMITFKNDEVDGKEGNLGQQ
ncbi:MAG: outer membrane protein assembly factor BamE [Verrucomicrobiota bacterium]|nr:outer membrane protein assembly factor BamE [Verrucomicrobiota bacterium]